KWNGQAWVNDAPKHPIQLRVFVEGGKVKSELIHFLGKDKETVMKLPGQYLKVTDKGLAFGHMNGMNPRGVIIFDGEFRDGVLEGQSKLRGIEFTSPPGMKPPVHRFTLEQKR